MGTLMIFGLAAIIGGYLLGSIPFGLIIAKLAGQGDIRSIGSGNIGATNVLRTGRKDLAFVTLLLDAGKAWVAVLLVRLFMPYIPFVPEIAGAAALLGHCFPVWLGFKGGKGVATFFGGMIAAAWPAGLIAGSIWIACAFITRYSSLSALLAAASAPIIAYVLGYPIVAVMAAFMALIIFIRHRENIKRLLAKTEPKIGAKKS